MPTSTQRFRLVGEDDASRAFLQVAAASRLLKSNMDDVSSSVLGLGKLMGGTSLIPVVAGASAAIAEFTTSLGAAGLAGGVLGLSVGGIAVDMKKAQEAMSKTALHLGTLTKGTDAYKETLKKLHAQQSSFQKDFGPAAKGLADLKVAFSKFKDDTSGVSLNVIHNGLELLAGVLPKLVPVSNAAGKAVNGLIGDLQKWTEGPSFKHLLHFLETSGPKDITAFGHSIGNVLGGLGGILSNFIGPGDNAAKTLERLTRNFDKWGHSKGVSNGVDKFLKYVGDNGPAISLAFESLAKASPKIAESLGKLGSANLTLTSKFLSLVAGLPQKQFNLIADGLFAMAAGSRALTAVTGLSAVLTGLGGLAAGKGLTGKSVGGGILGGAGSAGVQKVWVVNMGPGGGMGGPGGGGIPGAAGGGKLGVLGRAGAIAAAVTALSGLDIGASAIFKKEYGDTVGKVAGSVFRAVAFNLPDPSQIGKQTKIWSGIGSKVGGFLGGLHAPGSVGDLFKMPHDVPPKLKAISTAAEGVTRNLGKASQAMELVGHSAQRAFPRAAAQTKDLSDKLNRITGNKAQQAFDLVGHSASTNSARASGAIDGVHRSLAAIPNKTIKVTADTSSAMAALQNIQAYQIHDKSFTVTRFTNATAADHVSHSGGGGGGGAGGGAGGGMGASRGFGGRPVSWWQGTGAPLLSSIVRPGSRFHGTVNGAGAHIADFLSTIRGARQAGGSRLRNTIAARNAFAGGFQSFASSAFGASFGQDPTTGAEIAPTIGSILDFASGQRNQARMVKTDVQKLVRMGLSPALLKQLQAAGQAGIPTIQALAGASRSQIAQYNSLNKATALDLRSAGMSAGNRIFGQQIHKEEKHNAAVEHLLRQLVDMAKHHPDRLVAELKGDHIDLLLANTRRRKGKLQSDKKP